MNTENIFETGNNPEEPIPEQQWTPPEETQEAPASPAPGRKPLRRACASFMDIIPVGIFLTFLLILAGELLSEVLGNVLDIPSYALKLTGDEDIVPFLLQYFNFYGIWIVFILVITVFRRNWPMWKAFVYNRHGNNLKSVFIGILLGGGMNGFCVFMSWLQGDIKLAWNGFDPLLFFAFFICVFIQSAAEEIADRCYLYQKLRRRYRWPWVAVLVNSLFFMALHLGNPGVTMLGLLQVFLIGVLFSLIVYFWDSLWAVMWAHMAWNFSQSIVFGLPNSGIVSKYSLFRLDAASAADGLFYNTSFGVEGSLGANIMIGAVILLVLLFGLITKRGERMDYWKDMEENHADRKYIWDKVAMVLVVLSIIGGIIAFVAYIYIHQDELRDKYGIGPAVTAPASEEQAEDTPGEEAQAEAGPEEAEEAGEEAQAPEEPEEKDRAQAEKEAQEKAEAEAEKALQKEAEKEAGTQ
ncbi:MAG: CPBP family intramembrane glutamic endopeptidase, partial [bacterium]